MLRRTLSVLFLPLLLLVATACSDEDEQPPPSAATAVVSQAATQPPSATSPQDDVVSGMVVVDFTDSPQERETASVSFEVAPGSTAWEAMQQAIGEDNLTFEDFGGDLGVFVTGFYGVEVEGDHFWEFRVNGESSDVGVGTYEVQNGDVLEFGYAAF